MLRTSHEVGRAIQVRYDGRDLFEYVYRPDDPVLESPRPYLHPVRTLGGSLVTIYRPHDHLWHKGISWALPHLGPDNFWGGPTFHRDSGYVQQDNNGSQNHVRLTALDTTPERVTIRHDLEWRSQRSEPVVSEQRILVAEPWPDDSAWVLSFVTAMTNTSGRLIEIGSPTTAGRPDAGYGGLFWRGPRDFTGGLILAPSGTGSGNDFRGKRAPWLAFSGKHDGTGASSGMVFSAPDQPEWFVRTEDWTGIAPAPFFSTEVPFEAGATLEFRYAVVVADGAVDQTRAAALATQAEKVLSATN